MAPRFGTHARFKLANPALAQGASVVNDKRSPGRAMIIKVVAPFGVTGASMSITWVTCPASAMVSGFARAASPTWRISTEPWCVIATGDDRGLIGEVVDGYPVVRKTIGKG